MLIFIEIFDVLEFIFIILFCPLDKYLYFITSSMHMTRYFIWELTLSLFSYTRGKGKIQKSLEVNFSFLMQKRKINKTGTY